jgi:hypothetical protein
MRLISVLMIAALLAGCAGAQGVPRGAVAGCGDFGYIGTFTKSQTAVRALWLSDAAIAERMTVEDVIALAQALGCHE